MGCRSIVIRVNVVRPTKAAIIYGIVFKNIDFLYHEGAVNINIKPFCVPRIDEVEININFDLVMRKHIDESFIDLFVRQAK